MAGNWRRAEGTLANNSRPNSELLFGDVKTSDRSSVPVGHMDGSFYEQLKDGFRPANLSQNAAVKRAQSKRQKEPRLTNRLPSAVERQARRHLAKGAGILKVAKALGVGTGTVQRIKRAMVRDAPAT